MKKVTAILLMMILILALVGCGTVEDSENEISKLMKEGYSCMMSSASEDMWKGIFYREGNYDTIYKVVADMSEKEYQAYNDADFNEEIINGILFGLKNMTVTDISDIVPTQEEMNIYVGKTLGDLEKDGFENTGWLGEEETGINQFFYDGPVYYCKVTLAGGVVVEDMDEYSANDLRELEIGSVEFQGISSYLLDQN